MNLFIVRRSVLEALRQFRPHACSFDDICAYFPDANREQVEEELANLITWGYAERVHQSGLYKITAEGLDQITRSATALHYRVWGKLAL